MAFTKQKRNLTSPNAIGEPWIEQGYTDDCTTAKEIKAGVAGTEHFIKQIHITYIQSTTPKYYVLQDDNGRAIRPQINLSDYSPCDKQRFIAPLPCELGHGIWAKTEASGDFGYVIEGFSRQVDPFELKSGIIVASGSPSASLSPSISASISASVSASV